MSLCIFADGGYNINCYLLLYSETLYKDNKRYIAERYLDTKQ